MNFKTAKFLMLYGAFLILAGVVGYLSNPEKAKTALMSGGLFGSLSLILGWLGMRQVNWSFVAAKVSVGFLAVVFVWRSWATWAKVIAGSQDKLFAACLITSMLIASAVMLFILCRNKIKTESA